MEHPTPGFRSSTRTKFHTETEKLPIVSSYVEFESGHELKPAEVYRAMEWLTSLVAIG